MVDSPPGQARGARAAGPRLGPAGSIHASTRACKPAWSDRELPPTSSSEGRAAGGALAVAHQSVDHLEVVAHEDREELAEEVLEGEARGAAVIAVGALAPLVGGVDVAQLRVSVRKVSKLTDTTVGRVQRSQ